MKCLLCREVSSDQTEVYVEGKAFTHLFKSMRTRVGEKVLIVNGEGFLLYTEVVTIERKNAVLKVESSVNQEGPIEFDWYVAKTKRESQEEIVKAAYQCGVRNLVFFESEYSQKKELNSDRILALSENAISQSNHPWLIDVRYSENIVENLKKYQSVIIMTEPSVSSKIKNLDENKVKGPIALIVGPEGGFSPNDLALIEGLDHELMALVFNSPILRTEKAVVAGWGVLHRLIT